MEKEWIRGSYIGRGSFGTVSLAYDKSDGRVFAVKSVSMPSSQPSVVLDSLENEIRVLRSLRSPYVVSYLGDSTTPGWRNLHVEYVPGGTLADVAGKIDELQLRHYTRSVLRALSYLHSAAGVVHSDVKGRNILLGPTPGSAKLADFGSATWIAGAAGRNVGGTPLWMAPEVIRGGPPTPASDVWSLGCTVIEAATGRCPWGNAGRVGVIDIGFESVVPEFPASGLSKLGRDFLDKCLRREAKERWTAEELLGHPFVADVEGFGAGPTVSPRSVLDWVGSEFEEEDEVGVGPGGRERVIRELAEGCEGVNWGDDEGWMVVRCMEEEAVCESSSSSSSCDLCSSSLDYYDGEEEERGEMRKLEGVWGTVMIIVGVMRANPNFFTWVLLMRVIEVYRFMKWAFLNL